MAEKASSSLPHFSFPLPLSKLPMREDLLCYLSGEYKYMCVFYFQGPVSFEEVSVYFSKEEWAVLSRGQRTLHREVMMENRRILEFLSKVSPFPFFF